MLAVILAVAWVGRGKPEVESATRRYGPTLERPGPSFGAIPVPCRDFGVVESRPPHETNFAGPRDAALETARNRV